MVTALSGPKLNGRITMLKTLPTLTTAALLAATGALAQEAAPAPQEFEAAFTWSTMDISSVPMGESQAAVVSESFLVFSATDGPLAGLAGRCLFAGVADLTTMGIQDTATCVFHDAEGNQLWERIEAMSEGNGAPYGGTGTWIGGTGRFEGASGEHTFETTFSAMPQEGVYQGTGTKRGTLVVPAE